MNAFKFIELYSWLKATPHACELPQLASPFCVNRNSGIKINEQKLLPESSFDLQQRGIE